MQLQVDLPVLITVPHKPTNLCFAQKREEVHLLILISFIFLDQDNSPMTKFSLIQKLGAMDSIRINEEFRRKEQRLIKKTSQNKTKQTNNTSPKTIKQQKNSWFGKRGLDCEKLLSQSRATFMEITSNFGIWQIWFVPGESLYVNLHLDYFLFF